MNESNGSCGTLAAIHRYPVKSMMGEALNAVHVGPLGLQYDRTFALSDRCTGKVVSAKNPGKWPTLFNFRAALATAGSGATSVLITLPNGRTISGDDAQLNDIVSQVLGRSVSLLSSAPPESQLEEYWPDMVELPKRDVITDEAMPANTFFDCATVHVLTTATLNQLRKLHPEGRIEPRRFRPNLIVATPAGAEGFTENDWIGRTLAIGPELKLKITGPCPRCVMTTLAQDDLPADPLVLRTAAKYNSAHVGIYASVVQAGKVHRGDAVVVH